MAFNRAEKLKAEAPTLRQNLIHGLVQEFSMPLRSLGFNNQRDAASRWITLSLQTILDPRPIIKRTTATTAAQPTHGSRMPRCLTQQRLKVSRGPATIVPIDLAMMVLLVFEFHEKLETKDLMWKGEHMGYYLIFFDHLERLGEASPNTGGGKDAQLRWTSTRLPSGSDGRLHTDDPILASFLRTVGGCAPTEHKYAAVHINQGTAAASIANPHATSALGGALIAPPAHCTGLAVLESMLPISASAREYGPSGGDMIGESRSSERTAPAAVAAFAACPAPIGGPG
ncbi:hypothetical protein EDB85DRAFT_2196018 [Lactarius pseudohatsudake]|nr:hypothetical protein EDB85DRAFT_2196018 [Lactarius pseudohatsudake]